jgi:hypothetical protein
MSFTLRPTGLAPPVYKDMPEYEVLDDGDIGSTLSPATVNRLRFSITHDHEHAKGDD